MKIKVTATVKNNRLRIFMNKLLHLSVPADDVCGVHAYKSGGYFHIDYHVKDTTIECTYKQEEDWKAVLTELEKINII